MQMLAMMRKVTSLTEAKQETSAAQSVALQLADACLIFFVCWLYSRQRLVLHNGPGLVQPRTRGGSDQRKR